MYTLYALTVKYVRVRVTRGASLHIGILMRLFAAEPCSYAGSLFLS